jgi:hypothetical protein
MVVPSVVKAYPTPPPAHSTKADSINPQLATAFLLPSVHMCAVTLFPS